MVARDMSKFGNKYTCFSCGAKFYDLHKPEALCPKCGADQAGAPPPKPTATKTKSIEVVRPPVRVDEDDDSFDDDDEIAVDDDEIEIDDADIDLDADDDESDDEPEDEEY